MSFRKIIIRHSGCWSGSDYIGGDDMLVHLNILEITRDNLLREVQLELGDNRDYLLYYLTSIGNGAKIKVPLRTDTDLLRVIVEEQGLPTVYVIIKDNNIGRGTTTEPLREELHVDQSKVEAKRVDAEEVEAESADADEVERERVDEAEEAQGRLDLFQSLTTEFSAWIREPGHIDRVLAHRSIPTGENETLFEDFGSENHIVRNWLIPHVDLDSSLPLGWTEPLGPSDGQLRKKAIFKSKDELQIAVGLHHLENRLEYATDRSCTKRLEFICKHDGCTFLLKAKQEGGIWLVKKYIPDHTCIMVLNRNAPRQVPAKVLGSYFARRLITEGVVLKPKEMVDEVRSVYGIEIDYGFALRARNIAIEMTYGDFDKSYEKLPSYLYLLRERNPGSKYDIVTSHSDNRLVYMFLALGQSIQAFQNDFLRPVIVVDGTHLKGKNKVTLFVAVVKDGNEQVFPLAIGIGPIEDDESWNWFLSKVRSCFGVPEDLLIVSDQHISIENAVRNIYPSATHGVCFYHLMKRLVRFGQYAAEVFKEAAYTYRDSVFDEAIDALKHMSRRSETGGICKRLSDIGVSRWARSKCPVKRTSFMTSNPVETMNGRLLWARCLPVCSMIEVYRLIVEKWLEEHRASATSRDHPLTEKAFMKLSAAVEWGRHYTARATTTHLLKVDGDQNNTYIVDLQHSTCECREFDLDMIPCRHACAALRYVNGNVYDYVSHYFKQSTLVDTYSLVIEPVPHPESWNVPDIVARSVVRTPKVVRQAGRPRMARVRSAVERSQRVQRCTRCGLDGHNKRACTASIPVGAVDLNMPPEGNNERRRRKKTCSICHSEEHTRPRCPDRPRE